MSFYLLAFSLLLVGACGAGGEGATVRADHEIEAAIPRRSSCQAHSETPNTAEQLEVRVARLCQDDTYGDYLLWETRYVEDEKLSAEEVAVRELWRGTEFIDALLTVEVEDGLAQIRFPPGHHRTEAWRNAYGTAQQIREFFPPLLSTIFQFDR